MAVSFKKIYWTEHVKVKMKQYSLSKSKLIGIIYKPQRKELGIVSGTIALMQTNKSYSSKRSKKAPGEIWLMYKDVKDTSVSFGSTPFTPFNTVQDRQDEGSGQVRKIISAWRYPGVSKPGESIPIPGKIRQEIFSSSDL